MHSPSTQMSRMERLASAERLVSSLPEPDYTVNYQPTYSDETGLVEAVAETLSTTGVTTPRQADAFSDELAMLGRENDNVLVILDGCRETIHVDVNISDLSTRLVDNHTLLKSSMLKGVVEAQRNRGQYKKPRSEEFEELKDGTKVPSYKGDIVNGEDPSDREPDPSRMVAGAVQARDLEAETTRRVGRHIYAVHEALLLPYEKAFIRTDEKSGKSYSESADLLWAGFRTNGLNSPIIELLQEMENSRGVKIGGNSDEAHIAGLSERLNPDNEAGKLVFMLRLGLQEADKYPTILGAIKKHNPNSNVLMDIHGMTEKRPNGMKIRNVTKIIKGMELMALACKEAGVRFDGVHLETTPDQTRLECVDNEYQVPTHPGGIDPQLNPRQTLKVLNALAKLTKE